jgi:rhamnose transport system permease protein
VTTLDYTNLPAAPRPFRYRREAAVAGAYAALLLLLAILRPTFFRGQFFGGWVQSAPVVVVAVGMTLVLLARHVDISVGSQFSVCGVVAALSARAGLPVPLAAALAIGLGALFGAVNGALVAFLSLPSIVVTLATYGILRESLKWAREGEAVNDLPAGFQWLGLSQHGGEWALIAVAATVLVGFSIFARFVAAGRAVYAVGSDPEAARLAGLRPRAVTFGVFVVMGALTGLAAVLNGMRFASIDTNAGQGLELQAIAAAVVGGTAVAGGRGTLLGTLLGVALLAIIAPALLFLGVRTEWQLAVQGAIILLAVAADGLPGRGVSRG